MSRALKPEEFVVITNDNKVIEGPKYLSLIKCDPSICTIEVHENGILEISREKPYAKSFLHPGDWEELKV